MILGGNTTISGRTVRDHVRCGNDDCTIVLCVCPTRCWGMPPRACEGHGESFCDAHRDNCVECQLAAAGFLDGAA